MARFSWSALPAPLIRALTRDLDTEPAGDGADHQPDDRQPDDRQHDGDPTALRRIFGERPREEFIRAAWARLRDIWLARDAHARRAVVDRLVDAGLGDSALLDDASDPAESEMAYLRSCRNTSALRQAVLEVLVDTGMGVVPTAAARRRGRSARQQAPERAVAPSGGVLRDRVAGSWANFERRLTGELAALGPGDVLTLAFDPEARTQATEEGSFYVRLAQREDELVAEAAGNDVLPADHRLDRDAMQRLIEQGWGVPEPDGDGHFHVEFPSAQRRRAASQAVAALREVYGAPHPAFLRYEGRSAGGTAIDLPRLGLRHLGDQAGWEEPAAEEDERPPAAQAAATEAAPTEAHEELEERVRQVVAAVTELDEEALAPDEKSGIPVRAGSAMVFVRVRGEPAIVEVYSPVLLDVTRTSQLLEKLNSINASAPFVKTFLSDDVVYAAIQLSGSDFDPVHLKGALTFMTKFAGQVDEKLQGDFGGRPFFGEALPRRPGAPTGYYL